MQLTQAQRSRAPIKLGIAGCSGSGKTTASLNLSFGLTANWKKIAVIDTENKSSHLCAHLGPYNVLDLAPPFTPERYMEALQICIQANIEVIIIDTISFEWEHIVDAHAQLSGNSYTNWAKFTPRHQQFIQAILQADCHVICTFRTKQEYVLVEKNGKQVPQKMSMKPIQRDGVDYEFTLLFELDAHHNAVATKDRTRLFDGRPEFKITAHTGEEIQLWCNDFANTTKPHSEPKKPLYDLVKLIAECDNVEELRQLYYSVTQAEQQEYRGEFDRQKDYLSQPIIQHQSVNHINQFTNHGTANTRLNGSTKHQ